MSTPPPYLPPEPPASHQAPPGTPYVPATPGKGAAGSEFFRWVRGLGTTRSSDRWIGGVAGGVAARLGVDPLLVRGVFFVAALLGGAGFVLYGIAWALLPEPDGRIHLQQLLRGVRLRLALLDEARDSRPVLLVPESGDPEGGPSAEDQQAREHEGSPLQERARARRLLLRLLRLKCAALRGGNGKP